MGLMQVAGFKETQRGIWPLYMPISSTFYLKMQEQAILEWVMQDTRIDTKILGQNYNFRKGLLYLKQVSQFI